MGLDVIEQQVYALIRLLKRSYLNKSEHGSHHSENPSLIGRGRFGSAKFGKIIDTNLAAKQEIHGTYATFSKDILLLDSTKGLVLRDRKYSHRLYRLTVENGQLGLERIEASDAHKAVTDDGHTHDDKLDIGGYIHGEIFFAGSDGKITTLAPRHSGDVLTCMGTGADVAWQSPGAPGAHGPTHEPNGADEVHDIDILDTGTLLSAHADRHTAIGPDAISSALKLAAIPSVTQSKVARGVTSNPTTTSTSFVDLAEMQITLTTEANANVLVIFTGTFQNSSTGVTIKIRVVSDGSGVGTARQVSIDAANYQYELVHIELITGLSAGSHIFEIEWCVSGGTGRAFYTQRSMVVLELKR